MLSPSALLARRALAARHPGFPPPLGPRRLQPLDPRRLVRRGRRAVALGPDPPRRPGRRAADARGCARRRSRPAAPTRCCSAARSSTSSRARRVSGLRPRSPASGRTARWSRRSGRADCGTPRPRGGRTWRGWPRATSNRVAKSGATRTARYSSRSSGPWIAASGSRLAGSPAPPRPATPARGCRAGRRRGSPARRSRPSASRSTRRRWRAAGLGSAPPPAGSGRTRHGRAVRTFGHLRGPATASAAVPTIRMVSRTIARMRTHGKAAGRRRAREGASASASRATSAPDAGTKISRGPLTIQSGSGDPLHRADDRRHALLEQQALDQLGLRRSARGGDAHERALGELRADLARALGRPRVRQLTGGEDERQVALRAEALLATERGAAGRAREGALRRRAVRRPGPRAWPR